MPRLPDLVGLGEAEDGVHVVLPLQQLIAIEDEHLMWTVDGVSGEAEGLATVGAQARDIQPCDRVDGMEV